MQEPPLSQLDPSTQPRVEAMPAAVPDSRGGKRAVLSQAATVMLMIVVAGMIMVAGLPRLLSFGDQPSPVLLIAVGLSVIAITEAALAVVKHINGFTRRWLVMAGLYNALIILVKFIIAPMSMYLSNQKADFDATVSDPNAAGYYIFLAIVTFLLYALAFVLVSYFTKPHRQHLAAPKAANVAHKSHGRLRIALLIIVLLVIVGYVTGFAEPLLAIPMLFGLQGLTYLSILNSGGMSFVIIGALAAAIAAGIAAWREVYHQDEATSVTPALPASFFWIGLALIASYQILWIVYMATLVTIWPFKTYTAK